MLASGTRLGPYTVAAPLGQGGMGAVYRAKDAAGGDVALKVLAGELAQDPSFRERFRREATAAQAVSHRNVVRCLASGDDAGRLWIAFEVVAGGDLKGLVRERGALPWREAARLGAQIARGLAAVHGRGLVHRDVKPANVLLDGEGVAKIADLGLARSLGGPRSLTMTGEVVGTFEYIAPEQTERSAVDFRADLYSFGAVLYELLTGRPPFAGAGMALVAKHISSVATPPREVAPETPEALDALVRRLLAKQPQERGESALAVAAELDAIGASRPARGRALGALLAAGLVVAAAGVAVAVVKRPGPTPGSRGPDVATPSSESGPPRWYRETRSDRRPRLPLPDLLAFGESPGEYVARIDSSVLVYVPQLKLRHGGKRTIVDPFFIGKYEVSNERFAAFVAATGHVTSAEESGGNVFIEDRALAAAEQKKDPLASDWWRHEPAATWRTPRGDGVPSDPRCPVVQVAWEDGEAYAVWAKLRIPTVAEWVAAASWDPDQSLDVLAGPEPVGVRNDAKLPTTLAPCGTTPDDVTRAGIHDMAGNVTEWAADLDPRTSAARVWHRHCGSLVYVRWSPLIWVFGEYKAAAGIGLRVALSEGSGR